MNKAEYGTTAERYISALPSLKKSAQTIRAYKMILGKFGDYLAEQNGEEITEMTIIGFRVWLSGKELKSNTVAHYMTVLHGFFEWACRAKLAASNPVAPEEIPKAEQIRYDLLGLDEIEKTIFSKPRGIYKKTSCRNRAIVLLLILAGLRNSELRALTPADLDFERNVVKIRHGKGDKYREAPFPALARKAMSDYLACGYRPADASERESLFGSYADENGGTTEKGAWHEMTSAMLLGLVKRYVQNITGHAGIGTHDLRHAFASYASNKGVSTRNISLCMGHANEIITNKVYISILDKSKAATVVNAALDA